MPSPPMISRRRQAAWSTFALLLVLAGEASAQLAGVRVHGVAVDPAGPVSGVHMTLVSRRDSADVRASVTDSAASFAFSSVPAGEWSLDARRIGYLPVSQRVLLTTTSDTSIVVRMVRAPQALDTVRISEAGLPARYGQSSIMETFYARRQRGRGAFFTREDIEAAGHSSLQPLFSSVTGVRVRTDRTGRIYLTSSRCLGTSSGSRLGTLGPDLGSKPNVGTFALYIDGIRTARDLIPETLKDLSTADVEAMEVYRGPSELPAEALGDACAAVFIWTRRGARTPAAR